MGGCGSGRRSYSKATTSDYHQVDVRRWQREGFLMAGRFFACRWGNIEVVAASTARGEPDRVSLCSWQDRSTYSVRLAWTPCNYGGSRAWFICPARDCGRRVAILYGDGPFACRHCRQLAYDSQQDSGWRRSINQARLARMKLGGSANLTEPLPERPKGMHWRTYSRLYIRAAGREQAFLAGTLSTLTSLEQQISRFKTQGGGTL
jgi:hypothetical protein